MTTVLVSTYGQSGRVDIKYQTSQAALNRAGAIVAKKVGHFGLYSMVECTAIAVVGGGLVIDQEIW